jgi:Icc-related predicted phosphoesterase
MTFSSLGLAESFSALMEIGSPAIKKAEKAAKKNLSACLHIHKYT